MGPLIILLLTYLSTILSDPVFSFAFSPRSHHPTSCSRRNKWTFSSAAADPIIERARERAGAPAPEPSPKIFEEDLLLDMQFVLRALERRVKEGPEALTFQDVDELDEKIRRIVIEMKANQHKRPARTPPTTLAPSGSLLHAEPEVIQTLQASNAAAAAPPSDAGIVDTSEDEGPVYDGRGGMGQPKGTVNTYVIPGMDEMSPEQYQQTLQQSISDRQTRRRSSGVVGNLSSSNYLDSL